MSDKQVRTLKLLKQAIVSYIRATFGIYSKSNVQGRLIDWLLRQCKQEDGRQWGCHLCDKLYQQKEPTKGQRIEGQETEGQEAEGQQTEGQETEGQQTEGQQIKDFQSFWNKRECYGHDYKFNTISII